MPVLEGGGLALGSEIPAQLSSLLPYNGGQGQGGQGGSVCPKLAVGIGQPGKIIELGLIITITTLYNRIYI